MKKTIAAILAGALCLTALTACGGSMRLAHHLDKRNR